MTQFKTGDKVRYTGKFWEGNALRVPGHVGATGIVSSAPTSNCDTVSVTWDRDSSPSTPAMSVYQGNIEKVAEVEEEADAVAIFPPSDGEVYLTLDWNDAVILARALGKVNFGDLTEYASPSGNLQAFMDGMLEEIGRDTKSEAKVYRANVAGGQVFLNKV